MSAACRSTYGGLRNNTGSDFDFTETIYGKAFIVTKPEGRGT